MKSDELKRLRKMVLHSPEGTISVNRVEYAKLLHEVIVLRHKLRVISYQQRRVVDKPSD